MQQAAADSNLDSLHTRTKRLAERKGQRKGQQTFKNAEAKVSLLITTTTFKESKQGASLLRYPDV